MTAPEPPPGAFPDLIVPGTRTLITIDGPKVLGASTYELMCGEPPEAVGRACLDVLADRPQLSPQERAELAAAYRQAACTCEPVKRVTPHEYWCPALAWPA